MATGLPAGSISSRSSRGHRSPKSEVARDDLFVHCEKRKSRRILPVPRQYQTLGRYSR